MAMRVRRDAYRRVVGTKSLSFFGCAVKPSLNVRTRAGIDPYFSAKDSAADAKDRGFGMRALRLSWSWNRLWEWSIRYENLARLGRAHIIGARPWINIYCLPLAAALVVMPGLASSQEQTLCGQNDQIDFRWATSCVILMACKRDCPLGRNA